MSNLINLNDRFFIAGGNGMAGSAIYRELINKGYGNSNNGGLILRPSRKELDLLKKADVENWFAREKPNVVTLAAAKVGGIYSKSK